MAGPTAESDNASQATHIATRTTSLSEYGREAGWQIDRVEQRKTITDEFASKFAGFGEFVLLS